MTSDDKFDELPELRARGLRKMEQVYGFDMTDGTGDFFRYTADHLFADIWERPGLSDRDRRLLLIAVTGWGQQDDRRASEAAGFDLHLVKPANLAMLQSALASLEPEAATS